MNLKKFVRDYPKKGILFRDITSLIGAFNYALKKMYKISKKIEHTKIAGIESWGLYFCFCLSLFKQKTLSPLRKKNKLPGKKFLKNLNLNMEQIQSKFINLH